MVDLVELFADGQLDEHDAAVVRAHLTVCEECCKQLLMHTTLVAKLSTVNLPNVQQMMAESADHMVNTIASMEQRAIFILLSNGVVFSRISLYRVLDPMEQGILVDGTKAVTIKMKWPTIQEMLYGNNPPLVIVEMEYLPPFERFNKR